eukprot:scaffold8958_cov110-Isochrysis_galbana.AAC.1
MDGGAERRAAGAARGIAGVAIPPFPLNSTRAEPRSDGTDDAAGARASVGTWRSPCTSPATRHTDTRVRHNRHTRARTCVASNRWSYGPKADAESGA